MSHTEIQPNGGTNPPQIIVNNPPAPEKYFTAEDLERIRQEEKNKLYPQLEATRKEVASFKSQLDALEAERQTREEADKKRAKEIADAQKAAAEAEMTAKQLLETRDAEHKADMARMQGQVEQMSAVFAMEKKFQELRLYAQTKLTENQDKIVPELYDFVSGDSREEIDASIADVIARSERIMQGVGRMNQTQGAGQPPVGPGGFTTAGPIDLIQGPATQMTPEQYAQAVQQMSMKEFNEKVRQPMGLDNNNAYSMEHLFGGR